MLGSAERPPRQRLRLVAAILVIIPLGLLSRTGLPMPAIVAAYSGDTLYATLVYLLVALIWPSAGIWRVSLLALSLCVAVELSQLYHAPWIDSIRATLPGRLVLGSGFLGSDLVCYIVGALLGGAIDRYYLWLCARKPS